MAILKPKKNLKKKTLNQSLLLRTKRRNRPTWYYPFVAERYYRKSLLKLSKDVRTLIKTQFIPEIQPLYDAEEVPYHYDLTLGVIDKAGGVILAMERLIERMNRELFEPSLQAYKSTNITFDMVQAQNETQFDKLITYYFSFSHFFADPWLRSQRQIFLGMNVDLIESMIKSEFERVKGYVDRGLQEGSNWTTIVKEIKDSFGIVDRKAIFIARDQVAKLNAAISRLRQEELGVEEYQWVTMMDERVRKTHKANEGKTFRWDSPSPITGHPSHDVNCFTGDSDFFSNHVVNKLFRRFYTGELSEIITDNGFSLKATPNHPMLTDKGWVAIKDINVGDYVFETLNKGLESSEMDINNTKSSFKDCFSALEEFFGSFKSGTCGNFHGDISDNEIDIISFDCKLLDKWNVSTFEEFQKLLLAFSCCDLKTELTHFCELNSIIARLQNSSNSIVCGFSKLLLFVYGHFPHSDEICLATIANNHAIFNEPFFNTLSGDIVSLAEFKNAKTLTIEDFQFLNRQLFKICRFSSVFIELCINSLGSKEFAEIVSAATQEGTDLFESHSLLIKGHRVINKLSSKFSGHVYNLETDSGYYNIKGINGNLVTHNCRCLSWPLLDGILLGARP
jgi:SPP1 gp7 family putative phage head morphogenesis protein